MPTLLIRFILCLVPLFAYAQTSEEAISRAPPPDIIHRNSVMDPDRAPQPIERVDSNSVLQPTPTNQSAPDFEIASQIQALIASNAQMGGSQISVQSQGGRVSLEGSVATLPQVDIAASIASQVEGVKQVENHLTVRSR